jgi:gliding motility-associated-like protein
MCKKFLFLVFLIVFIGKINGQEICDNGLDDDGDGLTDCEEPGCYYSFPSCACTNVDVIWALTTEKTIIWINLLTGEEREIGPTEAGRDISWSPDGNLYTNDVSSTIKKIDYEDGSTISTQNIGVGGDGMVVGDDGIFYYGIGELVKTYNPSGGAITTLTTINGYKCSGDLAFLGGKLLVSLEKGTSGGGDSYVAIVDRATGTYTLVKILTTLKKPFGLESNANGVVYISFDDKIYTLNTTTGAISLVYTSSLTTRFSGLAILSRKCDCNFTADIFPTSNLCSNDTLFVSHTATDPVTISWILPNGSTLNQNFVTPLVNGQYIAIVKTAACPEVKDTLNIVLGQTVSAFSLGNDTAYCGNFSRVLSTGNTSTVWSNGQTGSSISISTGGTYWAEINGGCGLFRDSIIITQNTFPIVNLGNDTSICQNSSLTLNATTAGATYLWSNGSTLATITISQPQIYSVTVTKNGCSSSDSRNISILPSSALFIGNDTSFCGNFSKTLNSGNSQTVWSTGQTGASITVNQFGTYWGQINTSCGNIRDSILITQKSNPIVNLGKDTSICAGNNLTLNAGNIGAQFIWSTGQTSQSISVSNANQYWVKVNIGGCETSDTINVTVSPITQLFIGNDTTYCGNFTRALTSNGNANTKWSTGFIGNSISINDGGTYWAEINDGCKIIRDSIIIKKNKLPIVDLGSNQSICKGDTVFLNAFNLNATYLWNTGQTDSVIEASISDIYIVEVNLNGCKLRDSITIKVDDFPSFNLGNDTTFCGNFELTLSTDDPLTFWSNGVVGTSINAIQAGIYWAEISNTCGKQRDSIQLFTKPLPTVNIGPDQIICIDTILLDAYNPNFIAYKWNVGSIDSAIRITKPGLYYVFATDIDGCLAYDEVSIEKDCFDEIFVPTAFSPNNDGINDGFQILFDPKYIKILQLNVFNRWGEKVFETLNNVSIWDGTYKGKPTPIDQYIYWVEYLAIESNQIISKKGTVMVVK